MSTSHLHERAFICYYILYDPVRRCRTKISCREIQLILEILFVNIIILTRSFYVDII